MFNPREEHVRKPEDVRIPIIRLGKNLIVSVQITLEDRQALNLQDDILREIKKGGAEGLIIDISAMQIMDSYIARVLNAIAQNALLMGTPTVVVGMRPAIAITLVVMGMEFKNIKTTANLEDALKLLVEKSEL